MHCASNCVVLREKKAHSQCRDHRQPKRENHGSRRNSGLRCRQKGGRPQAASRGRHFGTDPGGGRAQPEVQARSRTAVAETDAHGFGRLKVLFADSAYGRSGLPEWVRTTFGWMLQTVLRPVGVSGFVVLPKRWIVERTFAWLSRCRRHSKDYERTCQSSQSMIHITMINLMSRRLVRLKT